MEWKTKLKLSGALAGCALFVTGCVNGWNVDDFKDAEATGTDFTKALYAEYTKFIDGEVEQEDWTTADYFALKGLSVAEGVEVLPEQPADWKVGEDKVAELTDFRAKLVNLLDVRGRVQRPDVAAKAQVAYDCLVEQSADGESHQPAHIKSCRENFLAAIAALEAPLQQTYVLNFGFGSAALTKEGRETLKAVAKVAGEYGDWYVRVEGHTDTVGNVEANRRLSLKRAANVREYLKKLGVEGKRLFTNGNSEQRLAVDTGDNVKNAENRRVVVTFTETK